MSSQRGLSGVGFKLTSDGNYDIDGKRLTNVAESIDDNDAVNLKVLKEHTQLSQNNYHLQPSFQFFKNFGDRRKIVIGQPGNPNLLPADHFYRSHIVHHDPRLVAKEGFGSGFGAWAWSSIKMTNDKLLPGTYTAIFEIFTVNMLAGDYIKDETLISQVYGDDHYNIITFSHQRIDNSYTKVYIQFSSDGQAGQIVFQIRYYGSQYDKNIRFIFHARVIYGKQSTSFNHNIFNVSGVDDNHEILYFENLNLNGNRINGLGNPADQADAANKKYVDGEDTKQNIAINHNSQIIGNSLFHLDGSKKMTGDLDMDGHNILSVKNLTDHKVDDAYSDIVKDLKSVVNKEYLNQNFLKIKGNDYDLNQRVIKNSAPHDDGSYDNNTLVSKAFVDAEIAKLPEPDTDVLKLDGSKAMTDALDMGNNEIKNLKDPVNNQDAGTKKYIDAEISKLPKPDTDVLKLDGSKAMQGNLYMNNNEIKNLKDPVDNQDAETKKWINTQLNTNAGLTYTNTQLAKKLDLSGGNMTGNINLTNSHKIINSPNLTSDTDLVTKKYMETHVSKSHVSSSKRSNAFKYVMDTPANHLTDEDDVEFGNLVTLKSSPHTINKNFVDTKLLFDAGDGYYSSRIGINLYVLPSGSYTLAFELIWSSNDVDRDNLTLNGISAVETIHNVSTKVFDNYSRLIVQFSKYQNIDPNHLYVDITIKMKTGRLYPPKLQTYMVCYGIKGLQSDVSPSVYDAIWGIDNGKITFNEMIDMNNKDIIGVNKITTTNLDVNGQIDMKNKDITGVNKITTDNLDVNSQIDMKGNKIIGVGDGTSNNDAVNKIQLDAKVSTVNNKITQIRNDINTILTQLTYFYFTDELIHKNHNTVIFPSSLNKPPFKSVRDNYDKLRISLSGKYYVSYTDSYKNAGQFQIYDDTNSVYPFVIYLSNTRQFAEFAISPVIDIQTHNGYGYSDIKLRVVKLNSKDPDPLLAGARKSAFYIKYLHP